MKLIRFHINNFGGLHDYDYEFDEGLNVILHDNGWGKTTMAAFLKAMLYGFDSKRSKDITENERRRYLPWQGGQYGGTLDFEADGVNYRITRTFGETPRFDKTRIVNLDTRTVARISPDKIGETLFKLDANAFQRSIFITQNGLGMDGAASSIHTRLNTLVSQANDVGAFDHAVNQLNQEIKIYEKTGNRGEIGDISREIAAKERQKDRMEASIQQQAEARSRIVEIDNQLVSINDSLTRKRKELEEISGDLKRKEAAQELLKEIDASITSLQQNINHILKDFGGRVPTSREVESVKNDKRQHERLVRELDNLEDELKDLSGQYSILSKKYNQKLPSTKDIDDIQQLYGELQGVLSSKEERMSEKHPPEYELIVSAVSSNSNYVTDLTNVIGLQDSISSTSRQLEAKEREIQQEASSWEEKKKRYSDLHAQVEDLRNQLNPISQYSPARINPVIYELENQQRKERNLFNKIASQTKEIEKEEADWKKKQERYSSLIKDVNQTQSDLEEYAIYSEDKMNPVLHQLSGLQNKERAVSTKTDQLNSNELTEADEALLKRYPDAKNTSEQGKQVLDTYRMLSSKKAELSNLQNVLEGETSKAQSFKSSLMQYDTLPGENISVVSEPKKSSGSVFIGLGALLTIGGIVLAFTMSMPLIALALIGVVLVFIGISNNNKYNTDLQRYQDYVELSEQRTNAQKNRDEIQRQLDESEAKITDLNHQIATLEQEINDKENTVNDWLSKYSQNNDNPESAIHTVMDEAEKADKLKEKKQNNDQIQKEITSLQEEIDQSFTKIKETYPVIVNKTITEAMQLLRDFVTEYKLRKGNAQNTQRNLDRFLSENSVTKEQIQKETSPLIPSMKQNLENLKDEQIKLRESRIQYDVAYPEIEGRSYEEAIGLLRKKKSEYDVLNGQLRAANKNEEKFLYSSRLDRHQLSLSESPRIPVLNAEKDNILSSLDNMINTCNDVLKEIGLSLDERNAAVVLRQANKCLSTYQEENRRLMGIESRNRERQKKISDLQREFNVKESVLNDLYVDQELPVRLKLIRKDIQDQADLSKQISEKERRIENNQRQAQRAKRNMDEFTRTYIRFTPKTNVYDEVDQKINDYNAYSSNLRQAKQQKQSVIEQNKMDTQNNNNEDTLALRKQIEMEETRRDALRDEYTQMTDMIRQGDQAATVYPDIVTEIHELYDKKQKAQNRVSMLKHTVNLITKAKENLADRYLSKVEQLFNNYMHIWLENDAIRGMLDIDFKVRIEEDDKVHVAEGYSTGYCDMIDFCMRLALVDTLFEKEEPFLVLDDPFVNLDSDRLNKALELINIMAINKQIIYFVCHPIRAIDTDVNDSTREEYVQLAESTKKMLASRKAAPSTQKQVTYKSPKERYQVQEGKTCNIELVKPGRKITNGIFSLEFKVKDTSARDVVYELFFIDEKGRVLNERQILEINDGELSNNKIQFNLNTRDDSGKEYELLIKESNQDNYDIVERIPFEAKLAFTGSFVFDF